GTARVGSATLELITDAGVSSAGGALKVGGGTGTLNVIAQDTVDLFSGGMDIGTIAGQTAGGDFKVQEHAAQALTVNAISSTGGEIVVQNAHGDLTVEQDVDSTGNSHDGNILLDSDASPHTSTLTLDAEVKAATGDIGLVASAGG